MIESAGFEVIDLGVDVSNDKIIECYRENPDTKIIALSALLTTTMPALRDAVDALNKSDFRSNIKVWSAEHRSLRNSQTRSVQTDIPRMLQVLQHWQIS